MKVPTRKDKSKVVRGSVIQRISDPEIREALKTPTEDAQRQRQTAKKLRLPYSLVKADPKEAELDAKETELKEALGSARHLDKWLSEDESRLESLKDDVPVLSRFEQAFWDEWTAVDRAKNLQYDSRPSATARDRSILQALTEPLSRGYANFKRGRNFAFSTLMRDLGILGGIEKRLNEARRSAGLPDATPFADVGVQQKEIAREIQKYPVPENVQEGLQEFAQAEGYLDSIMALITNPPAAAEMTLESLGSFAPSLAGAPIGARAGGGGAAAALLLPSFLAEYSLAFSQSLEESGVDLENPDPAEIAAWMQDHVVIERAKEYGVKRGIPIAIANAIGGAVAGKLILGAKPTSSSVALRTSAELLAVQPAIQGGGELAAELATDEYSPRDIVAESLLGVPFGAVEGSVNYQYAMDRVQRADANTQVMSMLNQTAKQLTKSAEDVEMIEGAVQAITEGAEVTHVQIDAQLVEELGLRERLGELSPTAAAELEDAIALGSEVSIPLAEYKARIATSDIADQLLDATAERVETQFQQARVLSQQEESEIAAAEEAEAAVVDSRQVVTQRIQSELNAANPDEPQKNAVSALLLGTRMQIRATQLGLSAQELYEIQGPKFSRAPAPSASYAQRFKNILTGKKDSTEAEQEQVLGGFDPDSMTVYFTEDSNFSTGIHEFGHYFLEADIDLVQRLQSKEVKGAGQGEVVNSVKGMFDWLGMQGTLDEQLTAWKAMSPDEKRTMHEQTAESFERYILEGKAPTPELESLFKTMMQWMLEVYKSIKQFLDNNPGAFELSPEVRALFDRMFATEYQIQTAQQGREVGVLFKDTLSDMDMVATKEAQASLTAKQVRDLALLGELTGGVSERYAAENADLVAQMRLMATQEIKSKAVYQAWELLTGPEGIRLNAQELESYPKLTRDKLAQFASEDGLPLDGLATKTGFATSVQLVKALAQAPAPEVAIEARTRELLMDVAGESLTADRLSKSVDAAIFNKSRVAAIVADANEAAKRAEVPGITLEEVQEHAEQAMALKRLRNIQPLVYVNAATRASQGAKQSYAAGDMAEVALAKKKQAILVALAQEAYKTLDESTAILRSMRKLSLPNPDIDPGFKSSLDSTLKRHGIMPYTQKDTVEKAPHYLTLNIEMLRGLESRVKRLAAMGKTTMRDKRTFEALANSITKNAGNRKATSRTPTTTAGRALNKGKAFEALHRRIPSLVRMIDGEKSAGPLWRTLVQPANKNADWEVVMRAESTVKLAKILAPILDRESYLRKAKPFEGIDRELTHEEVIMILANLGNRGNRQRLLSGEGWTMQQLQPVLSTLSKAEILAVQEVWDFIGTFRPLIAAKELRVKGKVPEWVEPTPITITTVEGETINLRGGYFPVSYDPLGSARTEQVEASTEDIKNIETDMTVTTSQTYLKPRAYEVFDKPVLLSMSVLFSGINEVIHDLAWHEWVLHANRVIKSPTVSKPILTHYGKHVLNQFKSWVDDIALGDSKSKAKNETWLSVIRQNVSSASLALNVISALLQPAGISLTSAYLGPKWTTYGVAQYSESPIDMTRFVKSKSSFMANRPKTRFRELNELLNVVQGKPKVLSTLQSKGYILMLAMQQAVDIPTWLGAYYKAQDAGIDEVAARDVADQAVIDTQGSGLVKDLAAIERGGEALKLFTVFYNFMGTTYNNAANTVAAQRALGVKAAQLFMILVVPAMSDTLLKEAFIPDEEEFDPEKLAIKMAENQVEYLFGTMVGLRELNFIVSPLISGEGRDYSGPAGLRPLVTVGRVGIKAGNIIHNDGEFDRAFYRELLYLSGYVISGVPAVQINRTIDGVIALEEGDTENPLAVVAGYRKER